ncbi:T9SS type A sorting domain-containing protein [Dyadobacter aurulentus]|uniref:T9SS type A sorting domain-containing protein n=1 Tax=Dyadobacter sp. UC 10 TaxID=2605428 RepID=UPI0011F17F15|nr:T9SS type A sorting domain-containing protein [Dyadobacter sp. UC 10]KAA0992682.1 T9SS type A sorting domain-containing protein [Dyadobacter sp. UC 10]
MKTRYTLLISLALLAHTAFAQNIQFDYDAGGNRVLRKAVGALPVTLVSFTAEKSNAADGSLENTLALLSWQTSAEVNFDRFSIQRSRDGKNWSDIGSVKAKGTTNQEDDEISNTYTFTDKAPAEGENLYRLKMIDKDESFAYSQIRNLYFELKILAYPNPVSDLLTLKWSALQTVQIFNSSGKMVYETSEKTSTIDVSELAAGVYIFKLIGNAGSSVARKIVKE